MYVYWVVKTITWIECHHCGSNRKRPYLPRTSLRAVGEINLSLSHHTIVMIGPGVARTALGSAHRRSFKQN